MHTQCLPVCVCTPRAASIEFFHRHHFTLPPFTPALSREFAPYKPNPASLLHIAEKWGVAPEELAMVGDSAKDDVSCCPPLGAGCCHACCFAPGSSPAAAMSYLGR